MMYLAALKIQTKGRICICICLPFQYFRYFWPTIVAVFYLIKKWETVCVFVIGYWVELYICLLYASCLDLRWQTI